MRKTLLVLLTMAGLAGCATDKAYYDAIESRTRAEQMIAVARAEADKARYAAIATMGNSGGDAAKVAAMFSLMQAGSSSAQAPAQQPIAPAPTPIDRALQVLQVTNSIVTPWVGPIMAYKQGQTNGQVAIAQAQANRDVSLGSYNAIAQVAANIPQPTTTTTTTNTTTTTANQSTTNSVGRDGVIGAGTLARTCSAGAGGVGAAGAAGGYAALAPALAASGVQGGSSAIGGAGGAGAPGGAGGSLNC